MADEGFSPQNPTGALSNPLASFSAVIFSHPLRIHSLINNVLNEM